MAIEAGSIRTVRGTMGTGEYRRLYLNNQEINNGWRVRDFKVTNRATGANALNMTVGILTTEEPGLTTWAVPGSYDFEDNRQIGWARDYTDPDLSNTGNWSLVDVENVIVEDLFVVGWERNEVTGGGINFYIEMEYLKFPKTSGIMAMIQTKGQDV